MEKKICLIIVYFGKLPFWLPAFQLSCRHNPNVDWMIFVDDEMPPDPPDNVRYIKSSWESFNQIASHKLGFPVNITNAFPYKMCDYKPLLGKIYEDLLANYDFWGHCDIDIIWGNIRKYISDSLLDNYDMITSRPYRISGHFCLYRNKERFNHLFKEVPGAQVKLSVWQQYLGFDESELTQYIKNINKKNIFNELRVKLFGGNRKPAIRIYWDEVLTSSGRHQRMVNNETGLFLKWKEGSCYHVDGSELMYLHFHKLKNKLKGIDFGYSAKPSEIIITESNILSR